jgi:hypothetical protein
VTGIDRPVKQIGRKQANSPPRKAGLTRCIEKENPHPKKVDPELQIISLCRRTIEQATRKVAAREYLR